MSLAEVKDTLLTDGQVARALGISPKTIWNRRAAGTWPIPSIKLPQSRPRTRSHDLRMYLAGEASASEPRGGDAYGLSVVQGEGGTARAVVPRSMAPPIETGRDV